MCVLFPWNYLFQKTFLFIFEFSPIKIHLLTIKSFSISETYWFLKTGHTRVSLKRNKEYIFRTIRIDSVGAFESYIQAYFWFFFPSRNLSKNLVWFWRLKWKRYYLCLLHTYKYSSFDYLFWNVAKFTIRTRHLFKISNISNLHWFQIKFSLHLGTWITVCGVNHDVYHVPKYMFCHEATVVITGRAHCFPYYVNINTYKIWHSKEIRKKSANTHLFNCFTP